MQFTIRQLRRSGFKVRVIHKRHQKIVTKIDGNYFENSAKGGTTIIQITTPDKQTDVEGVAVCSIEDNYDRKVGNAIALGRALSDLNEEQISQIKRNVA
jgi:hypothetical protein